MHDFPGGHRPGNGDRMWSIQGHGLITLGAIIGGCGPGGRHPAAVDAGDRAAGGVGQQDKSIATQPTRRHNGDGFRGGDGQGCIKGIATFMEDLETSTGGQWGVRTDHAAAAVDQTSRQTVHGDHTSYAYPELITDERRQCMVFANGCQWLYIRRPPLTAPSRLDRTLPT